ncbi:MAG: PIG-L family deacetylase [Ruthenibacterium sp.]
MTHHTILAIGGHVGDMELTAGALLATCSLAGGHIATLALTAGEKGVPAGQTVANYRAQKLCEANAFAQMLHGESYVLDYADGLLPDNDEVRFAVCDIIRKVKPDILITHHKNSMHKDHAACHRIVEDARFYAGISGFERSLPAHFARTLYFAENWEDSVGFTPYVYLDVSAGYTLWKEAVATHWFALHSTSFPYLEYYDALTRVRGIEARTQRAECFMIPDENHRLVTTL